MLNSESFSSSETQKIDDTVQKLDALIKILKEEDEFDVQNAMRMKYVRDFKNQELINKDGDLFLTVDSLIRINNLITGSPNIHLRQITVKPAGCNKQYMDTSRIEPELYYLVNQFNDRRITPSTFCDTFLDKIHPFADRNSRTCKILFGGKIENFHEIYKKPCFFDYLFFPNRFNCEGTY